MHQQVHAQRFTVPFGRGTIEFGLPDDLTGSIASTPAAPIVSDPAAAARVAIARPIASPPLRRLAKDKQNVCIAVTDATRACPDHILVPAMLDELHAGGVTDDAITILVAVGAHRASTLDEKREKLGAAIVERYRIIDHDGQDDANLLPVIDGPVGEPFRVSRIAIESDLLLATGVVEPHQYAGYSGGGKTVAIGCGDENTIAYTHGPAMLDQPGTRLAQVDGNPFQTVVRRVAAAANLAFVGNAILNDDAQIVAIAYGAPNAVHDELATIAAPLFTTTIPSQVDIAIAGVGYPKDANLYQASRAASYLQFAPVPVVRPGGVIIIPAACPEGAGKGVGEQRFLEAMSAAGGPREIIDRARREGIRPGAQRAFVMARVLEEASVIVAGIEDSSLARQVGFMPATNIDEALAIAIEQVGTPASVLVVPHALLTLPIVNPAMVAG
ncbi:MAG: nickel-dependent lactate racemase [Chloroflexota bacterium]|nr:nickel-dependent lactate racemase [Chloroflexia bacterium]MDQ3468067.1 nickel-dependent lactate racemase [Chloroflexota bacterium]